MTLSGVVGKRSASVLQKAGGKNPRKERKCQMSEPATTAGLVRMLCIWYLLLQWFVYNIVRKIDPAFIFKKKDGFFYQRPWFFANVAVSIFVFLVIVVYLCQD
jgi:hypothetical protein